MYIWRWFDWWGGLTVVFTGKFVYIYNFFTRLNSNVNETRCLLPLPF